MIDLSRIGDLADTLKSFSVVLSSYAQQSTENWVKVATQRALNPSFGGDTNKEKNVLDVTDLGSLADRLAANDIVPTASRAVSAAVRQAVLYRANGAYATNASGLSIYFPSRDINNSAWDGYYSALDFPNEYKSFVQNAMLAIAVPGTDANVMKILANRPIEVDPDGSAYGITAQTKAGWPTLNEHLVSLFPTSMESRTVDGNTVRVATLCPVGVRQRRIRTDLPDLREDVEYRRSLHLRRSGGRLGRSDCRPRSRWTEAERHHHAG
ncbi:hypothetical protein BPUN_3793 [Candidatus Paraburkholderia kirkii]|nr:hypothetical protein BPUN_3793 [Candidatus Paraburkholderia kirkii]